MKTGKLPLQDVIDMLETDIADLERRRVRLVDAVNLLREKVGLPPRELQAAENAVAKALESHKPPASSPAAESRT